MIWISPVNDATGEKEQEKFKKKNLAEDTNILVALASTKMLMLQKIQ